MAVKFETIKAGDVLYDVHREKMGNTTMSAWGWWRVRVISIDHEKRVAKVSWNTNPPQVKGPSYFARLRRSIPKKLAGPNGNVKP